MEDEQQSILTQQSNQINENQNIDKNKQES